MSTLINQTRFYLRNRALLFWSYFLPAVLLTPLTVWAITQGKTMEPISLLLVFAYAMSTAFFLSSSQQDVLSKAFCFLMPRVRRSFLIDQVLAFIVVAALAFAAAFLLPGVVSVVQGSMAAAVSLVSLVLITYSLTVLVVLQFPYASWLPFQSVLVPIFVIKFLVSFPPERIHLALVQMPLLAVLALVAAILVGQQMRSRALYRKVAQRPYISLADLKNTAKIEEFKRARNQHKTQKADGARCLQGVFQETLKRASVCRENGNHTAALVWEAIHLTLCNSIPRTWWKTLGLVGLMIVALAVFGYFDYRAVIRGDGDLDGWFSGMVFMGLTGVGLMAYHLRVRTTGRLFARRDALRAGVIGAGVMVAAAMSGALMLLGIGELMAAVLPKVTMNWNVYYMVGPRWYLLGSPLFFVPVQMIVFSLWRKPGPNMVIPQTGTLSFMVYHGFFNFARPEQAWIPAAVVIIALWLALPWVWRWRILHKDQI